MNATQIQSIDLATAQGLILRSCTVLSSEKSTLAEAVGRIASRPHKALQPLPDYDASLRDGYAVGQRAGADADGELASFAIVDEVAAGDTRELRLDEGEAVRIMTGGLIPAGCERVIPQEACQRVAEKVQIPIPSLQVVNTFIYEKGSEAARGQVLLPKGVAVSVEQQLALTGAGYESVDVARKPRINVICTGSELLTDTSTAKLAGQRFSGNGHLLSGLIARSGALLQEQATVEDDVEQVAAIMARMAHPGCDILISTGGMGPGKFDLIEQAFARCGGETIYSSLTMRPGKSTLFGKIGTTLFFGLPGPPPAVQLLFHELIRPAICALQGREKCRPQKIKAILSTDLSFPKRGLLRLKSGVLSFADGVCLVRLAGKGEESNCYIFCPADRQFIGCGEKVMIHLTTSSQHSV